MPTKWNALTATAAVATNDYFVGYNGATAPASGAERRWLGSDLALAFARTIGNNLDGTDSVGFGNDAGLANITGGNNNVFFGDSAGVANTTGSANVFVGQLAGGSNTIGARNIFIGQGAGQYQTNGFTALTDSEKSIYIGYLTEGSSNSAQEEIAIGYNAEAKGSNTAAIGNTSQTTAYIYGNVITSAGYTGLESNFVGRLAGNTSAADYAVGVGHQAHYQTTASADRAVGVGAYAQYQSGSYGGVAAGYRAGDSSNGDYSIYIGYEAGLNDLFDNVICIGKGVTASADNEAWWGPATITKHVFQSGNLGIGITAPGHKLDVQDSAFTIIRSKSTAGVAYIYTDAFTGFDSGLQLYENGTRIYQLFRDGSRDNDFRIYDSVNARDVLYYDRSLDALGVGTTAPERKLHVSDAGSAYIAVSRTGVTASALMMGAESGSNRIYSWTTASGSTGSPLKITVGAIDAMYFDTSGNVGIGTVAPNANAILDVSSTTKAFMPPRMTTTQKNAISSPTAGMVVYDSTLSKLAVYTGSAWETVTSA